MTETATPTAVGIIEFDKRCAMAAMYFGPFSIEARKRIDDSEHGSDNPEKWRLGRHSTFFPQSTRRHVSNRDSNNELPAFEGDTATCLRQAAKGIPAFDAEFPNMFDENLTIHDVSVKECKPKAKRRAEPT